MKTFLLYLLQTSKKLVQYQALLGLVRPKRGWVRTIRQALGMTSAQLAKRLDVNQSTVMRLEKAEQNNSITLKSLLKAARALNCQFVYALVPNTTLEEMIQKQAEKVARKKLEVVAHHMTLENQRPTDEQLKEIYQQLLTELLEKNPRGLWKDD